jgi:hypothetical protein
MLRQQHNMHCLPPLHLASPPLPGRWQYQLWFQLQHLRAQVHDGFQYLFLTQRQSPWSWTRSWALPMAVLVHHDQPWARRLAITHGRAWSRPGPCRSGHPTLAFLVHAPALLIKHTTPTDYLSSPPDRLLRHHSRRWIRGTTKPFLPH